MGSTRCRHFVQNAWKKDLCSNCFKSRDEHVSTTPAVRPGGTRPGPVGPATNTAPPPQGILKGASRPRKTPRKVYFPPEPEECEVIGEGGEDAGPPDDEDYDRPDDLDDDWGVSTQEDDPHEREEDKILQALTRSNTDFNSVASNLLESAPAPAPDPRKARAPLQLGKPLTDAEGKKQTLLVSVQPFGGKGDVTDKAPHVTKILTGDIVAKSSPKTASKQPKDNGGVVLKSIVVTNNELKTYVPSDPKPTPPQDGDASKSKEKNLYSKSPVLNGSSDSTLLKQKDAQTKANDSDKSPSAATPTATTTTTTKKADTTSQINSKHMFLKSIVDPGHDAVAKTPDSPGMTSLTTNGKESEIYLSPARAGARPEGKRTHITRGTPISKNNELLLKTKFNPLRMSAILSKNNERNSELNNETAAKKEQNHIVGFPGITMAPREVVLTVGRTDSSSEDEERTYSNIQVSSVDRSKDRSKDRQRDRSKDKVKDRSKERPKERSKEHEEGAQTKRLSSLLAATLKSTDGEVVIVNRVGSRELAGEPDGRADPDSSSESGSEPPALPRSPPPAVDPRPSFLHGVHSLLAPITRTPDKPQVPFKSSSVVQAASSILSPAAVSARWSQLEAQMKAGSGGDPPQAPSSSPPSTPTQESPLASPQGSPPDSCSRAQKRQAPKPPQVPAAMDDPGPIAGLLSAERRGSLSPPAPSPVKEEPLVLPSTASPIYARGLSAAKSQSPVCREKDKRLSHLQDRIERSERTERNSPPTRSESVPAALGQVALGQSVTLGTQSGQSVAHALAHHNFSSICAQPAGQPTPSPRRALSLSTDSLGPPGGKHVVSYDTERKKMGTKVRFSLRKFLGLHKDAGREEGSPAGVPGEPPAVPQPRPRPRLEIIHPSDLSGASVEVLRGSGVELRRQMQEAAAAVLAPTAGPTTAPRRNSDVSSDSSGSPHPVIGSPTHSSGRPSKPPPPPRSQSLDCERSETAGIGRPSRPPPPKSAELLRRQKQPPSPPIAPNHSVYANLAFRTIEIPTLTCERGAEMVPGEVRSGMAPLKPQRTGSVRDTAVEGPKRTPLTAVVDAKASSASSVTEKQRISESSDDARSTKDSGAMKEPPKMPVRTCSLPHSSASQPEDSGYESVELSDNTQPQSMTDSENVYECVNGVAERSSSPECDSKRPASVTQNRGSGTGSSHYSQHRRSDCGLDSSSACSDYQRLSTFGRPASMPYCGSETESDIYSPYSFYGSEEGDDGEADTSLQACSSHSSPWKWRCPGRGRKGRSIVHKSMEDNYGAVVGANLEALAQLLEQIRTGPAVPPTLRPLKAVSSLSWSDFTLETDASGQSVVAGRWIFLPAHWGAQAVTLGVVPEAGSGAGLSGRGPFSLMPITEFCDLVPASCLPSARRHGSSHVQAWVGVLTRLRVDTLSSYGAAITSQASHTPAADSAAERDADLSASEEAWREAGLALLQLVNALKGLQAQGTEEASPDSLVFLREPVPGGGVGAAGALGNTPQLTILNAVPTTSVQRVDCGERSLCQCALAAVRALLPSAPTSGLLTGLLSKERAESLSRTKSVLEFWLWGPAGLPTGDVKEREVALQRWLDLERATVLHRLVCARAAAGPNHKLAIPQQNHLLFLVHTSAKTMSDASQLLGSQAILPLETTNF